jgi:hypothetical protein
MRKNYNNSVVIVETIVIYITNAVGYILQHEVFKLKHDRAAGLF